MRAIHNYIASHLTLILLPATSREITNMADYVLTNGSQLFFVDASAETPTVNKFCAVSVAPDSSTPNKIDITELCETVIEKQADGLRAASELTMDLIYKPQSDEQKALLAYKGTKTKLSFVLGGGDGTDEPTYTDGAWAYPAGRTFFTFAGDISNNEWQSVDKDNVYKVTVHINIDEPFEPVVQ